MENETTSFFGSIEWTIIIAQFINLLIILAPICLGIYIWKSISRWNKERNQILHRVSVELTEIKNEMRRNRES
jgi:uncharacterized membrane protein (DUF485 family)